MKKVPLLLLLLTLAAFSKEDTRVHFSQQLFDSLLVVSVHNGRVNYRALKQHPEMLNRYLRQLQAVDADSFQSWSREEQMAFWINAYNAITLKGILDNYPIHYGSLVSRLRFPQNSIRQISGFWDKHFVPLLGKEISLNDIEHRILREKYRDPRIHFTLVCASLGCPDLRDRAYPGQNLDEALDNAARKFINDSTKVFLDQSKNILYLSSIFDWYRSDFRNSSSAIPFSGYDTDERGILSFIARYLPPEQVQFIQTNHPKIKFLDYDWSLNEQ